VRTVDEWTLIRFLHLPAVRFFVGGHAASARPRCGDRGTVTLMIVYVIRYDRSDACRSNRDP